MVTLKLLFKEMVQIVETSHSKPSLISINYSMYGPKVYVCPDECFKAWLTLWSLVSHAQQRLGSILHGTAAIPKPLLVVLR